MTSSHPPGWLLRSGKSFSYQFPYQYIWKLIALFFFSMIFSSTILFGEFTWSIRMYLPNDIKRKKKRHVKTKLVRGGLSNGKVFPPLLVRKLVLPWRWANFVLPVDGKKKRRPQEREEEGWWNDTKFRHNCTTLHFFMRFCKREAVTESVGSNFSGLLWPIAIKKKVSSAPKRFRQVVFLLPMWQTSPGI